jgi:hypothetical protein
LQLKKAARAEQAIKEKKRLERIQVASDLELMGDTFGLEGEEEAATAVDAFEVGAAAAANGEKPPRMDQALFQDITAIVAMLPLTDVGSHMRICAALVQATHASPRPERLQFVTAFLDAATDQLHVDELTAVIAKLDVTRNIKLAISKRVKKVSKRPKPRAFARVETTSDLIHEGSAAQ